MVLILFEVGSGQFWSVLREGVSFKVRTPRSLMMMMMMMKPRPSDNVGLSEERAQPRLLRPITLHKRNNHQHRPPGSTLELPSNGPVFNERLRDETKAQKHWVIRPNLPTPRSLVLLPSFLLWFYSASVGQRRSEQEDVFPPWIFSLTPVQEWWGFTRSSWIWERPPHSPPSTSPTLLDCWYCERQENVNELSTVSVRILEKKAKNLFSEKYKSEKKRKDRKTSYYVS